MTSTHIKRMVKQQFGQSAQSYVDSQSHANGDDLQLLIQWLNPSSTWRVLDIASGGGHVAKILAPYVASVLATDITPEMLLAARDHMTHAGITNVQYMIADAEDLPFLEATFDVVTCRIAPHHFSNPGAFVREVARVLKPQGQFVLIDNVAPESSDLADFLNALETLRDPSHVRCLPPSEWRHLLDESQLVVMQEQLRKKRIDFSSWVTRMVRTEDQRHKVERYASAADESIKSYFQMKTEDGQIHEWSVDEWMLLARKR